MLKKSQRLSRTAFDRFFSQGKRLHAPFVQIIYGESVTSHGSAVVGKKVSKKAVERNLLRRRMYGILYPYIKATNKPRTVILIAKPSALSMERKQFASELKALLGQIFSA